MDLHHIRTLTQKYLDGETSLLEEQQLRDYFSRENVDVTLQEYKPLFNYFVKAQEEQSTSEFHPQASKPKTKMYKTWMAVAASIALVATAVWYNNGNTASVDDLGTYENPEIALQKTRDVLNLVASYMNEGTEDLRYLAELDNTKDKLIKDNN